MSDLTAVLNAGGQSSRMGTDKALVALDGRPLLAHVRAAVETLPDLHATILITNTPDRYAAFALPAYTDVIPGKGALGGIYSALHHSQTPYVLLAACDMPFIQAGLLRYMQTVLAESGDAYDIIVPRVAGHPQGTLAIYRQTCRDVVRANLDADRLKVIGFYEQMRVRYLDEAEYTPFDPQGLSFFNVNTPEDLERARRLGGQTG
jgi:molybdenum cofactor guanylyltransferase